MIYVPRKKDEHMTWGAKIGTLAGLEERNRQIYKRFEAGMSISELAAEYFLSDKNIQRIIRAMRPLATPPFPLERIEEMTRLMGGEGSLLPHT
ncbi:MAG: hypothetical protein E7291_00215 [Lachnospiraceae bacterium]|nr:hypothetical protein [Lachnospiraceae bacterium]